MKSSTKIVQPNNQPKLSDKEYLYLDNIIYKLLMEDFRLPIHRTRK